MDEGSFDQNFTWFEWGFVSPDEMWSQDSRVPLTGQRQVFEANGHNSVAYRLLEQWDEDHRWPT